jgi:hypothetical protein
MKNHADYSVRKSSHHSSPQEDFDPAKADMSTTKDGNFPRHKSPEAEMTCEFQYPCEVEQLLRDHKIRSLLDEFIQKQMFANLVQTLNRILNRIIESDNAKAEAIVIAWAIGIRDERTESSEATLKSLSRIDVRRTRSWLVKKKSDVLQVLAK